MTLTTETTENPVETQPAVETNELTHTHTDAQGNVTVHQGPTHDHNMGAQPTLNPALVREIAVEVDAWTVSKAFSRVVKKYTKLARIPGFRVGKVPESVVRTRFAQDIRQEVLDSLVSERFRMALEGQNLNPVSQPQLTNLFLVDGQPLQFKAAFEVLPEIDLSGYDATSVEKPHVELTDAEYKAEFDRVMEPYATVETVDEDRALGDGDWAEIEFKGQVQDLAQTVTEEGKSSEEAEGEDANDPIIGEDVLIEVGGTNTLPAFSDALRGSKVGQEMSFEVTYPADFGEPRLAGQTVKYDVTVKTMKKKTFPERDEEFLKQLGSYESFADFEAKLRESAGERKKEALENVAKDKLLAELIEKYQFPVPESFVQQQIDARLDRGLRQLAQQGMTEEDMRKLDFNRLRAAQRDQALAEVKASLILDKVAELEGVSVEDEELEREIMMASLQAREPMETVRERFTQDGTLGRIKEQMRREKTGAVLYEKLAK
jgi:trigger factor